MRSGKLGLGDRWRRLMVLDGLTGEFFARMRPLFLLTAFVATKIPGFDEEPLLKGSPAHFHSRCCRAGGGRRVGHHSYGRSRSALLELLRFLLVVRKYVAYCGQREALGLDRWG